MSIRRVFGQVAAILTVAFVPFMAVPARAQGPSASSDILERDVAGLKAENAALREQLRRLEEQQKTMLDMMSGLQRRLEVPSARAVEASPLPPTPQPVIGEPARSLAAAIAAAPLPLAETPDAEPALSLSAPQAPPPPHAPPAEPMPKEGTHYDGGFVLVNTSDTARFPFKVTLNNTTQFRFTQTQPDADTFTDHLSAEFTVLL